MTRAKTKFLTFTTYENTDPRAFTRMEWHNKCKELPPDADLFEAVYLLFNEEIADWVWGWSITKEAAIEDHDKKLDEVIA